MRGPFLVVVFLCAGCSETPLPASTFTTSDSFPSRDDRVRFLNQYVAFRRTYHDLSFSIEYHNHGGGRVPAPSEWDVRIVASVPANELSLWIPAGVSAVSRADYDWIRGVPGGLSCLEITEWYVQPGHIVGIDRMNARVVYRSWRR